MRNHVHLGLTLAALLGSGCTTAPSSWQPSRITSLTEGWTRSVYSLPFPTRELATHDGHLYVLKNRREIMEIQFGVDKKLLQVKHRISSSESFGNASALSDGEIYVVATNSGSILVLNFEGEISKRLNVPVLGGRQPHISALVFEPSSRRLWGTDAANHRVLAWEPQRSIEPIYILGKRGTGALEFNYPADLAVEPNGSVLVLDRMNHRIQRVSSSGHFAGFLLNGVDALHRPTAIAVEPQGNIWVYDSFSNVLLAFSKDGLARRTQNGNTLELDGPAGCTSLEVDMHNRLWLADALSGTITMIEINGSLKKR